MSKHIWHPYTQMKTSPAPLKVRTGRGVILELEDGRELIDCVSSWSVNLHGHAHPKIGTAIFEQAQKLEQVMFAGFTHEPAEKLAEMLIAVLPKHLTKVFYSDNGSTAVEVALKQAYQYWKNLGEDQRTSFLCFQGSYHGDTIGTMSLGSRSVFNKSYEGLLFDVHFAPYPSIDVDDRNIEEREAVALAYLESQLAHSPNSFAAIIIEPLVQSVGGMHMCRPTFLLQLQKLARLYGVLLIYDEVMTGFGRTGDWFACSKSQTQPDIICLAKGLTGGFLPLAVTVCTERVYEAFYADQMEKMLFHGHSYTANPLGCAAAIASLELLHENPNQFQGMEARHRPYLDKFSHHPLLKNVRTCGTIAAMDLMIPGESGYMHSVAPILRRLCLDEGLIVRPFGNMLYLMPPYCISDDQLQHIYRSIESVLNKLSKQLS